MPLLRVDESDQLSLSLFTLIYLLCAGAGCETVTSNKQQQEQEHILDVNCTHCDIYAPEPVIWARKFHPLPPETGKICHRCCGDVRFVSNI
jgi:hypothetical protein